MTSRSLAALLFVAAACSTANDDSPVAPSTTVSNNAARIDTIGLPDLIVDQKSTENKWRVKNENLPANFCSVQEGGVTPGNRRLLRFTVTTPNIGDADVYVGSPLDHYNANDGLYELSGCHDHFHFQHYATYSLIGVTDGQVWRSAKQGFCMLDTDPYSPVYRDSPRNYSNCGTLSRDGFQGISKGWSDTYVWKLGGQYFVLDGGDGQRVVPAGWYYIQVEVNPAYAATGKKACPRTTDPATGLCHQFTESNYANNTMRVKIYIPASGPAGPYKNEADPTAADEIEHAGQ